MGHQVFISHSSKDKNFADALVAKLEGRSIRCWVAPRDIPVGVEWAAAILNGIEQCQLMVIIFSQNSNNSPQVLRELERAINHRLTIIPIRIEDMFPTGSMEYYLSAVHWLDAINMPIDMHLETACLRIESILNGDNDIISNVKRPVVSGKYLSSSGIISDDIPVKASFPELSSFSFAIIEAVENVLWAEKIDDTRDFFRIKNLREISNNIMSVKAWGLKLSNNIFKFSSTLENRNNLIKERYGSEFYHADFSDLKNASDVIGSARLIDLLGLRSISNPQIGSYDGVDYWNQGPFVTYNGSVSEGTRAYFVSVHDGILIDDWRIIDTIDNHNIDLGSWHNNRPILLKSEASMTIKIEKE